MSKFSRLHRIGLAIVVVAIGGEVDRADASTMYSTTVLSDNPAAYWRLGESSGTTANDETANNNDGLYGNYRQDVFGSLPPILGQTGAIVDDPNTAILNVNNVGADTFTWTKATDSISLSPVLALSVEAWVTANSTTGFKTILSKVTDNGNFQGYGLFLSGGEASFFNRTWTTGALTTGLTLSSATYTHIVGTYDSTDLSAGVNGTLKIYVNGVLSGTAASNGITVDNANPLFIGGMGGNDNIPNPGDRDTYAAYTWDGKIDEVAVYGTALTAAQIQNHFEVGLAENLDLIPEPSTVCLLGLGGGWLWCWRRRLAH